MSRSEKLFGPLMWLVILVATSVSGCGGGGGSDGASMRAASGPPTAPGAGGGVGGAGHGPTPINLFTAGNFAIVGETAITDLPPSVVTGNVGLSPASGAAMELTCAEVTGRIYIVDAAGPTCMTRNAAALLNQAVADGHTAWNDGIVRVPDYTDIGTGTIGNIGGFRLPPATYKWSTGVQIPADLTLTGGPDDVWIFLIEHDLNVSPGVRIILDGALPQNVYWLTLIDGVELGAGSQFAGVILAETSIFMRTGASINGRLLAAQSINLDTNTVTQP
jgi:hypothetical protein